MTGSPFETAPTWKSARELVTFEPRIPAATAGQKLQSLRIHVRDHKLRELEPKERTLEAHYNTFVVSQAQPGKDEARRLALDVKYGRGALEGQVAGRKARIYELGPEPATDDVDGRSPAVVTWHDEEMFYLVASTAMPAADLERIAESLYTK